LNTYDELLIKYKSSYELNKCIQNNKLSDLSQVKDFLNNNSDFPSYEYINNGFYNDSNTGYNLNKNLYQNNDEYCDF
jgi:hypothetical protein